VGRSQPAGDEKASETEESKTGRDFGIECSRNPSEVPVTTTSSSSSHLVPADNLAVKTASKTQFGTKATYDDQCNNNIGLHLDNSKVPSSSSSSSGEELTGNASNPAGCPKVDTILRLSLPRADAAALEVFIAENHYRRQGVLLHFLHSDPVWTPCGMV